jgi:hypothetical protein
VEVFSSTKRSFTRETRELFFVEVRARSSFLWQAFRAHDVVQGHGIHFRLFRARDEVVLTYFETPDDCQDPLIMNTNASESTSESATEIHPAKFCVREVRPMAVFRYY